MQIAVYRRANVTGRMSIAIIMENEEEHKAISSRLPFRVHFDDLARAVILTHDKENGRDYTLRAFVDKHKREGWTFQVLVETPAELAPLAKVKSPLVNTTTQCVIISLPHEGPAPLPHKPIVRKAPDGGPAPTLAELIEAAAIVTRFLAANPDARAFVTEDRRLRVARTYEREIA